MIRLLVVDDHAVVRQGLRALLETQADMEVVAEAANGRQAVDKALAYRPHLVLMDLVMPEVDGLAAIRELQAREPAIRIVALTSFAEDERVVEAVRAGVSGYLLKDVEPQELLRAIRQVHAGGSYLQPAVTRALLSEVRLPRARQRGLERLTQREVEVLRLIGQGQSNAEIARQLGIAEKTVKTHVSNLLAKLGLADRTQAALHAVRTGLVDPRSSPSGW